MKHVLAIYIGAGDIRMLMVHSDRIIWAAATDRADGEPLGDCIRRSFPHGQTRNVRRAAVRIVVNPRHAQYRRVSGLPPIVAQDVLAAIVHERRTTFFRGDPAALVTTSVRVDAPGTVRAGAIATEVVSEVIAAAAELGLRLEEIVPAAAALEDAALHAPWAWSDGALRIVDSGDGAGVAVRRGNSEPDEWPVPDVGIDLSPLAERAAAFLPAAAAARSPVGGSCVLDGRGRPPSEARLIRRKLIGPALSSAAAVVALLLSPLQHVVAERQAERMLNQIAGSSTWHATTETYAHLERVASILNEIAAFEASRIPMTGVLAAIAVELPAPGVITRIEINADPARGTLDLVVPDASNTFERLARTSMLGGIEAARSPRQQETVVGPMERIQLNFRPIAVREFRESQ